MSTNGSLNRKLRMALVGGGQGAFIGRVPATAAGMDNRAELVAGCLSSNAERAKASAPDYDIAPGRAYTSIGELVQQEKALPADQRVDFVSVATPNHTHFEIAKGAADAGFNVMCDKPMTFDLAQAEALGEAVDRSGVVFAVTHNYTAHPLVRQAGPGDDRQRRAGRDQRDPLELHSRLAADAAGERLTKAGGVAHGSLQE